MTNTNVISYNFTVAKILSILMVVTGHYFGGLLWIPTTFALFIFGFSSGFFTGRKYNENFGLKEFWYSKILRLLPPLFIINLFLLILFSIRGKEGITTWQTILCMLGLNGFLDWAKLNNPSPFGHGLWFFTVLLIYYFSYPLLRLINKRKYMALGFLIISLLVTTLFHYVLPMGYALWLTVFSFLLGSYLSIYHKRIRAEFAISIFFSSCFILLTLNFYCYYKQLNYFLILLGCISTVIYLINTELPKPIFEKTVILSGAVIYIYFIHTYLFLKSITIYKTVNFISSLAIIILTGYALCKIQGLFGKILLRHN